VAKYVLGAAALALLNVVLGTLVSLWLVFWAIGGSPDSFLRFWTN
jgi:hypothetical protein